MSQTAVRTRLSFETKSSQRPFNWNLFIASFVALYFELLVIRFVSAEMVTFGVLKNLPLIASFFGMGIGMLRMGRTLVGRRAFVFIAVALFLLSRFGGHLPLPFLSWEYVVVGAHSRVISVLGFVAFVTGVLWLIVGFFVVLGGFVGKRLGNDPPLAAYGINLAGSLAGILVFTALSFLRTGPGVWFAIGFALLLPLIWRKWGEIAILVALLAIIAIPQKGTYWSPYHRIDIQAVGTNDSGKAAAYSLEYNHSWYQTMVDLSPEFVRQHPQAEPNRSVLDYYETPYRFVPRPHDVLVVGAGTGNDVAAALRHGAEHVDAVEIDPVILGMGRRYHPEQPYASPKVNTYVDDARAFFTKTGKKYDLIVFGFLDSSTLLTSFSSLRLDNYVYTRESFEAARKLLKPDGTLVLAFAVTRGYVADRLFVTLTDAFKAEPRAFETRTNVLGMLYVEGAARLAEVADANDTTAELRERSRSTAPATDHWPFLYLERKSVPTPLVVVLLTFVLTAWMWQRRSIRQEWNAGTAEFFLLGAGFMLMETKAVTQLSLLFGSTWVVNAAVISAFLVMALIANALAARVKVKSDACYIVLLLLVAVGCVVPYSLLSGASIPTKIAGGALWAALPVFFSGMLFSSAFKNVSSPATALGMNILGALVGGVMENTVMLGGSIVVGAIAVCAYAAAWTFSRRARAERLRACSERGRRIA